MLMLKYGNADSADVSTAYASTAEHLGAAAN